MVIAFNIAFSRFVGEKGIIAYAVVNNIHCFFLTFYWDRGTYNHHELSLAHCFMIG